MDALPPLNTQPPPDWSLFVGQIGRGCVYAALAFFAIAILSWLLAGKDRRLGRIGAWSFGLGCGAILSTFAALAILFAANRFEFAYVFSHADNQNPLAYRIAGIWSGQEGSFLLWATCSAIFALLTVGKTGAYRRWYSIVYAFFLGGLANILAFESPFNLNIFEGKPVVPADGLGLAPSLQNYWVIIHPPTIFLGFASLTALFALAFAALAIKDFETWIPIVRPWTIVAVTLVGLGLCMGGFWAYETLGWGGFWMWDPVENVSFVPWCFAAAFIHGIIVQATKKKWQISNLLFGALPFLVFVYGTFLTRSGFLSEASVHSFAEMDRSALKLLIGLMAAVTLGFGGLWAIRAFQSRKAAVAEAPAPGLRREAFYMIGITALLAMGVATMIGMSVPLLQALQGQKPKVVEESLYHQVLPWIFVPLMLLMAVTPFVAWNGMKGRELLSKVYTTLCITVGLTGMVLFASVVTNFSKKLDMGSTVKFFGNYEVSGLAWILTLVGLCFFVLVGNAWRVLDLFKRSKMGTAPFLAHIGVAILMAGLIISRGFERKAQALVMENQPGRLLTYEVRYAGMTSNEKDRNNKLKLDVYDPHKPGEPLFTAMPGLYKVRGGDGQESTMVWPHIERGWLMDTYISLGQPQTEATDSVTMAVGKTIDFNGLHLSYKKMTHRGDIGALGTKFGAEIEVSGGGKTKTINPELEIGPGGETVLHPAELDDKMELALLSINAADRSVTLQVRFTSPLYPIEVYHKPMTVLVWAGTGLMTLSGFLSAFYRRSRSAIPAEALRAPHKAPRARDLVTAMQGETK